MASGPLQADAAARTAVFICVMVLAGALGCARTAGPLPLGAVFADAETVSVMRLRPDAAATSCRRWLGGILLRADPDDAIARLLATEPDANVLIDGTLLVEEIAIGPYVRQCVTFRGVLSRTIRTVTIPSGGSIEGHHHH